MFNKEMYFYVKKQPIYIIAIDVTSYPFKNWSLHAFIDDSGFS